MRDFTLGFAMNGQTSRLEATRLDAHWEHYFPLREELELIFENYGNVLIDDFNVEDDPGYGFDSYGPNKMLDLDLLRRCHVPPMFIFYSSPRSDQEADAEWLGGRHHECEDGTKTRIYCSASSGTRARTKPRAVGHELRRAGARSPAWPVQSDAACTA